MKQLYVMVLRIIWSFKIEISKDPSERDWDIDPRKVRPTTSFDTRMR